MAAFPTTVATDSDLYIAVNATSTQLTDNPLTSGATTVNVVSAAAFPSVGFISVDNEIIQYTGKTGASFTGCTRGADGTSASSHVQNSQVFHNVIAIHHNALKDEIIAVEADLVGVQPALADSAPGSTASTLLIRVRQIVTQIKAITGTANWYDAISKSLIALVALDGSRTMTGNLPMGSNKLTGLSAGSGNGDSVRYEQTVRTTDTQSIAGDKTFTGTILKTNQPSFLATMTTVSDVTGDGTAYTVAFGTEVSDPGSNYDPSSFIFTAPVTGLYNFSANIYTDQTTAAAGHAAGTLQLVTTGRTYTSQLTNSGAMAGNNSDRWEWRINVENTPMNAGDTAKIVFTVSSGTKTIDIINPNTNNFFSGQLVH